MAVITTTTTERRVNHPPGHDFSWLYPDRTPEACAIPEVEPEPAPPQVKPRSSAPQFAIAPPPCEPDGVGQDDCPDCLHPLTGCTCHRLPRWHDEYFEPSPEEIAFEAAAIRAEWSESEHLRRARGDIWMSPGYTPEEPRKAGTPRTFHATLAYYVMPLPLAPRQRPNERPPLEGSQSAAVTIGGAE